MSTKEATRRAVLAQVAAGTVTLAGAAALLGVSYRRARRLYRRHRTHGRRGLRHALRRWMVGSGLWTRQRRGRPVHTRRPRRAAFGELVQLDGSFHDWFEGRGP